MVNIHFHKGFGLIEVLVSVLILAIGLLGLAGLQAQSLRFNSEAYFRSQATLLAMDMSDRMRANYETARTNKTLYTIKKTDTVPSGGTDCESTACTPAELAAFDFKQWREVVDLQLPGGKVSVTPVTSATTVPWQEYVIEIEFDSTDTATLQTFRYRVRI